MRPEFDSLYGTIMAGAKQNGVWLGMTPAQRAEYAGKASLMVQNYLTQKEQAALTNGLSGQQKPVVPSTVVTTTSVQAPPEPATPANTTAVTQIVQDEAKLPDKVKIADKIKVGTKKTGFKYYLVGEDGKVYEVAKKQDYNRIRKGKSVSVNELKAVDTKTQKLPRKVEVSSSKIAQKHAAKAAAAVQSAEAATVEKYGKGWGKIQHPSNTKLGTAKPTSGPKTLGEVARKYNMETPISQVAECDRRAAEIIKQNAEHAARQAEYDKMAQEYREMKDRRWQKLGENKGQKSGVAECDRRAAEIIKQNAEHAEKQVMYEQLHNTPESHITELKGDLRRAEGKVTELTSKLEAKGAQIGELENAVARSNARIGALENTVAQSGSKIGALENTVAQSGSKIGAFEKTVAKQGTEIANLTKKMGKMNARMAIVAGITAVVVGGIGYLAGKSGNQNAPVTPIMPAETNDSTDTSNEQAVAAPADTTNTTPVVTPPVEPVDSVTTTAAPAMATATEQEEKDTTTVLSLNEKDIYIVKEGDTYWKLAKHNLEEKYKNEPDKFANLPKSEQEKLIRSEWKRLLRDNGTKVDNNGLPVPMIHPNDTIINTVA